MAGIFSRTAARIGRIFQNLVAVAKKGYNESTGVPLPESLAKRQISPTDSKPPTKNSLQE
jgi:hypothetical protein